MPDYKDAPQSTDTPLISGPSVDQDDGRREVMLDPSTGRAVFTVVETSAASVRGCLSEARAAAGPWGQMPLADRGRLLSATAELLAHEDGLVDLIISDVGKPIMEARAEYARAKAILNYYAGLAQAPAGELYEDAAGELVRVLRFPRGVAALITPWNFPLAIPVWKTAAALLAGNAVVLKPAPAGTRVAARLIACLHAAGVPAEACVMIAGDANPAQELLSARPDVISFTGSLAVGRRVAAVAGEHRIPVQLEMGGQNAVYVSAGANPDEAAKVALAGAMGYAGQKCTATRRIVVHIRRAAELVGSLTKQLARLPTGSPHHEATVVGPMISRAARDQALSELEGAVARGVQLNAGGKALAGHGFHLSPTLISGGDKDDRIYREEVFAPILGVKPVASFDEGLSEVNATPYGLVAGIVSPRRSEVETFARAANAGVIRINAPTTGLEPHVPFGGSGVSSLGPREQGRAGLEFFSESRTIYG